MKPILASLLLLPALTVGAAPAPTHPLTPQEAAAQAQRSYGGKVLDIRQSRNGGYRVKILKDGRVRVIEIGARARGRDD